MVLSRRTTAYTLILWLTIMLFGTLGITFALYVHAEKEVDRASDARYQSLLLADELRQSADDLTRMVRSYVVTGDPRYKQNYQDILAIRNGLLPRPPNYKNVYWDLTLVDNRPRDRFSGEKIALLDLMRKAQFSDAELRILSDAKAYSDQLSATEFAAMTLIETDNPISEAARQRALNLVFGDTYNQAKAQIMRPINLFYSQMEKRTTDAVNQAEQQAFKIRLLLIGVGLSLVYMLWRIQQTLNKTLGGTVDDVYRQIARIGSGDFTHTLSSSRGGVLAWLNETQSKLSHLQQAQQDAEAAQRKSEERYRALFDYAKVGINIFRGGSNNTFIDANPWLCQMLGYTHDEFIQLRPADVVVESEAEHIAPAIQSMEAKEIHSREWILRRKDGSTFFVDVIGTTTPDGTILTISLDISERKLANEKLRRSEEDLSITLQSIGDAVIATDAAGLITRMNPTAERMTGWTLAQANGLPLCDVFQIINADTRESLDNPVQKVMEQGQVVGLANHTVLIARDGTEYQIADSAAPIRDSAGSIMGVVLVFSDVTEKYKAEEALREKEWLLSESQRIANIGSWSVDLEKNKITWSDETYRIYGVSPETFEPTRESFISLIHPEDLDHMLQSMVLVGGGLPIIEEFRIITPSGDIRYLSGHSEFLAARLSSSGRIVGTVQDITARKKADERFHNIFRLIPNALTLQTMEGVLLDCSNTFCEMSGYTREEVLSQDVRALNLWVNPEQRIMFRELLLRDGQIDNFEFQLRRRDDSVRTMQISARQITLDSGPMMLSAAHDISDRKKAELDLQESAFHTQAILDNMFDGVVTINIKGVIESINKAACSIFGYRQEEVIGHNITALMPPYFKDKHNSYLQHHQHTLDTPVTNTLREVEGLRKNGSVFPMSLSISKVMRDKGITFVGVIRDISQQRQDEEEIHHLAFYDALTNLPNRRLLFDRLQQAILTSSRTDQHGALMFLDLDHFKQLNDTLGHDIGDILLQQVADRLQACVREGDSVARMGGDEFVILIESLSTNPNEAATQTELIADKILAALGGPYTLREHAYVITPSIGIVVFLHQTETMDELLKKADVAMYQAKTVGRNNARFFDPAMQAAVSMRLKLETDMHRALEQHEFILHYQLQVDADSVPTGVEALVRWNHGKDDMIFPGEFIPLAEETGMILPLGQWVLETACAQLTEWAKSPKTAHLTMAVNVSVSQFAQPDFVSNVNNALRKTGANPHLLKLELTESMLLNDIDSVIIKMFQIKATGVSFSLDDFGTGYSSLTYLKRLPIDQLKIDKSFVRDLLTDPNDATIARTIVALGHSLNLKIIAEGVETAEQRDLLHDMGCDAYQGYYFAWPVLAEDLPRVIKNIPA